MTTQISTRNNFYNAHGKDFIIDGIGSFFMTNSEIRKVGGVKKVKEIAEDLTSQGDIREENVRFGSGAVLEKYFHTVH